MLSELLSVGQQFPAFNLKNQDGENKTFQDYKGRWLVLYVYPKDDTPGCTIQGKSFTSSKPEFDALNITIVGLSSDDVESHKNFCNKFSFTIELLADPKEQLLSKLGIEQSEYKGVKYWNRSTFVVDPAGKLRKVYLNVKPEEHEKVLLKDITELQKNL